MLRPKIFPMLWKTWVAYGLPHGFVRHDKILPIQPPNLKKKNAFPARPICFQDANSAAIRSKWVAASGRPRHFPASGRKWPPQTLPSEWPQVAAPASSKRLAASGGFLRFQFPPSKQHPWKIECRAGSLVPMRFFHFLSQVLCLARKRAARSYEVLHLSCKIISANVKIW